MGDDLVRRLRAPMRREQGEVVSHMVRRINVERHEAAAEIARLTAERDEWKRAWASCRGEFVELYDKHHSTPCEQIRHAQEVEAITAERDALAARLREAEEAG